MLEDNVAPEEGGPNLWISTNQGLSRFSPETESFRNYDKADGLQSNAFYSAQEKGSNGMLYFGGANGFNAFNPAELQDNPHLPPVVLVGFQLASRPVPIGGDSALQKSIAETNELVLSYQDRVITFRFSALNYSAPVKNRYRYMLEGFDNEWTEVSSDQRIATYTNLDPGKYTFRVIGSNNDGAWNEEGAAVQLTITPPWWETTAFRGLLLLFLFGLVAGGYGWRVRAIQARTRQLESEVADKTRQLRDEIAEHENTEKRLRRTRDELATLLAMSRDVVSTLDLDLLLQLIMEQLGKALEYDAVSIHLLDDNVFRLRAFQFAPGIGVSPPQRLFYDEIPGFKEMVVSGTAFVLPDLQKEPELMSAIITHSEKEFQHIPPSVHSFMSAPLASRQRTIGMLSVSSAETDLYGADALDLLQAFANQAAIAIENARLYGQARETAVAEERERLGSDLHDAVTQTLFSASVIAEATPRIWDRYPDVGRRNLEQLSRLLRGALAEMRTLLFELRPAALVEQPLDQLLANLTEAAQVRARAPVDLSVECEYPLPTEVRIALYRIAQEALNNVAKHAEASAVHVELSCDGEELTLRIRDDGRGFDPATMPPGQLGLGIMQERAAKIDFTVQFDSKLGKGTEVVVTGPYKGEWDERR
jgi:signal transduction histidine kinase